MQARGIAYAYACVAVRLHAKNMTAGGKWTTYRRMAEDAVDEIVKSGRVRTSGECCTVHMPLVGAQGYTPALFTEVAQNYTVPHRPGAIDTNVAKHLAGLFQALLKYRLPLML